MDEDLIPFCAFCDLGSELLELLEDDDPRMIRLEDLKLYADVLGNHWCEDHRHLGRVINWGARHKWPLLSLRDGTIGCKDKNDVYIIPGGKDCWYGCLVANRNIDVGYLVEAVIDMLESEDKAS